MNSAQTAAQKNIGSSAELQKSSYGFTSNYYNLRHALRGLSPYSTGGIGTDIAALVAPGNITAKYLGVTAELLIDLFGGLTVPVAVKNALGPLNSFAMERVYVSNPANLGFLANGLQVGDLIKTSVGAYNDL